MNVKFIGILLSIFFITSLNAASSNLNIPIPIELSQNAFNYVKLEQQPQNLLPNSQHPAYFKTQYFRPWDDNTNQANFSYVPGKSEIYDTKKMEEETIKFYQDRDPQGKIGYNKHYQKYENSEWLDAIKINMDLDNNFPNISCSTIQGGNGCKGIMVDNEQLRSLPTTDAYYFDFEQPGEGYPFDYIQLSDMWLGTPVQLIHQTKDSQWILIKGQGILGWVPAATVATVDTKFINKWRQVKGGVFDRGNFKDKFITPTVREQSIIIKADSTNTTTSSSSLNLSEIGQRSYVLQVGSILPKTADHKILFPIKKEDATAQAIKINMLHTKALAVTDWPLEINDYNFKQQINALGGMRWGNFFGQLFRQL